MQAQMGLALESGSRSFDVALYILIKIRKRSKNIKSMCGALLVGWGAKEGSSAGEMQEVSLQLIVSQQSI